MATMETRLTALEQRQQRLLGYRTFTQSLSDPAQYFEGTRNEPGKAYTETEIDALGAAGWQCIVIVYESQDPAAIRLTWGDELPDLAA